MPRTAPPAAVALTSDKPGNVDTDLLFVPAFEGESLAGVVTGLDEASGGAVRERASAASSVDARSSCS